MTEVERLIAEAEDLQRRVGKARIELNYLQTQWAKKLLEVSKVKDAQNVEVPS